MTATKQNLAFVFPGQGSQSVGMLGALAERYPLVKDTFSEASEYLKLDLWKLCREGPEVKLNETQNTQPALLTAGVAVWRLWEAQGGLRPGVMAGHSLGEYTALVAAGSLDFADAVRLVAERGRRMQRAVPAGEGAMAAIIGLDNDAVEAACQDAAEGQVVSAANYNAPGQVVIAGHAAAVTRAMDIAKAKGARRALLLAVSVPSHCALMRPAAEGLIPHLAEVAVECPKVKVLHNVDIAGYNDPAQIRDALLRQLYSPVRWTGTIQHMAGQGITRVVECGPGKVLSGLMRRIDHELEAFAIGEPENFEEALHRLSANERK